ncbi:MAG: hypothetical protein GY702_23985, partial [Desulfobulbaceae bacterium]|nr:hypothetical protein [Desulfobulbaceae bacterium]
LEHCSSLHTNWLVRETISHYNERGSTVYLGSLDVAKAFDTIWHNGFFYMLHKLGLDEKIWRLIVKSYTGFKCCVSIGGINSELFQVDQGFHQGAPFSMTGFNLYDNILIKSLTDSLCGLRIEDMKLVCPAFADDIVVMSTNISSLQTLMDLVYCFSCKWRLNFNANKCALVVYGRDNTPLKDLTLGRSIIKRKPAHTYLGTLLSAQTNEMKNYVTSRIQATKGSAYNIKAIGSRIAPVTPISASHVYKTVCLPKLLYGMELMPCSDESIDQLENFQASVAKAIQRLPDRCTNMGAVRTMGWLSIRNIINITRLIFLWKLILLPISCLYTKCWYLDI